jgi:putative sugar O-methyltransferase
LEHVTYEQGLGYFDVIKRDYKDYMQYINEYKKNDLYGSPVTSEYDGIGHISPSTLRYIKTLSDLQKEFGSLDDMKICEIGVGYGGQCRIICSRFKVKSYTLVDLPHVLPLVSTYLNHYPLSTELKFKTMNELKLNTKYDLFISNYAFSELSREIQDCYYNKTISNTKKGYLTYNSLNFGENKNETFGFYTVDDYKEKIPNMQTIPEEPLTAPGNQILVWK